MSGDRVGNSGVEGKKAENLEASLAGSLKNAILLFLKSGHSDVKLYASDPSHEFSCDPASGIGELRMAEIGDADTIQIFVGNKTWRVVDLVADIAGPTIRPPAAFSGISLQLDEKSLRAVRAFQVAHEQTERQKAIGRGKERMAMAPGPTFVGNKDREKPKSGLELILENNHLIKEKVDSFNSVQSVIERVCLDRTDLYFIDIKTKDGQDFFCEEWFRTCGRTFPMPFVPPENFFKQYFPNKQYPSKVDKNSGDFRYLILLSDNRAVGNVNERYNNNVLAPRLVSNTGGNIMVMGWSESDEKKNDAWGRSFLESPSASNPILEALEIKTGVFATRKEIDEALYDGDPVNRKLSKKHKKAIAGMGLDPAEYMLRLIDYGEYLRLVNRLGWGNTTIETHYDGYGIDEIDPDKKRYGLCGGNKEYGGVAHANFSDPNKKLAVRLVLVRR